MADEPQLNDELRETERALRALSLRQPRLDRDRLMYLAGQESALADSEHGGGGGVGANATAPDARAVGRRPLSRWFWQATTVAMSITSAVLGIALANRAEPEPRIVQEIVYIPREESSTPQPEIDADQTPDNQTDVAAADRVDVDQPLSDDADRSVNRFWPVSDSAADFLVQRQRALQGVLAELPIDVGNDTANGSQSDPALHSRQALMREEGLLRAGDTAAPFSIWPFSTSSGDTL